MGRVVYDVPLVTQLRNPICWITCMAMVSSERLGYSIGVGHFAQGFDPSNSAIANPATGLNDFYDRLERCNFSSVGINSTASELENTLKSYGPLILTHNCTGFPYGPGRAPITNPAAMHAVVITGIDSSINGGMCWMNNPWGDKDCPILTTDVITSISKMLTANVRMIAYYRQ
ncbi:papain-like cysteine protease family protein [Spirosoma aerophilum]